MVDVDEGLPLIPNGAAEGKGTEREETRFCKVLMKIASENTIP